MGQTVTTNKVDYFPGDKVLASGKGWNAFEQVDLLLTEQIFNNPGANLVVTADASGSFSQDIYTVVEADRGAFFHLKATGRQSGHIATITFNDAGGDYGIDFSAYDPTRYVPESYVNFITTHTLPSGRVPSPLIATTSTGATNHAKTRESLMPESLGLGQIVPFEFHVRADAAGACSNDILSLSGEWLTTTTNGGAFGYDGTLGIVAAFVCTAPNGGLIDPQGDATVINKSWTLNGKTIEGTIQVAGVDPGDELTVEVWLVLQSSIASNVGGNVKSRLTDAASIGTCEPGKINTGNQEIPLLQVDDFLSTDVDVAITKQDLGNDVVRVGDNVTYEIVVSNSGPSVANTINVQDVIDPNTTYVSHQFIDGQGAAWSFAQSGGTLNFTSDFLNVGESAKILVTVHVENSAPRNGVGGEGVCVTGADLCNNVTVTTISDDTNSSNDSDSEPTGVMCTDLTIGGVIEAIDCFGAQTGSIVLTVGGGVAPYTYIWSTGANTKDVTGLMAGTYNVTVTDATGCSGVSSFTVEQPAAALACEIPYPGFDTPLCGNYQNNLLTVQASGGTAPYTYQWSLDENALNHGWSFVSGQNAAVMNFVAGSSNAVFSIQITDANGCVTTCTYSMQACMAEYYCTYTQGFYGNEGGYACSTEGRGLTARQIMQSILPVGDKQVFGLISTNRYFTLHGIDIANGSIFNMLPGGKTPAPLGSYPGGATYSLNASWIAVPISKAKSTYGKIENNLLSQTIVLYFNMGLNDQGPMNGNFTLANFQLKPEIITAESPDCGVTVVVPMQDQYVTISSKVLDYLNSHYSNGASVANLFDLANRILGGDPALVVFGQGGKATYPQVSAAEVSSAIDAINNIFHECRVYVPEEMQTVLGSTGLRNATAINISSPEMEAEELSEEGPASITVEAYPNPFSNQVNIEFTAEIDGHAELGVYTLQGVLVENLFKGNVRAHETQRVTFQQGAIQSGVYVYRLSLGNQVKVGKLISVDRK